ncbi:hypothetical protein B0H14DRAFT_2582916 [Mycena olivaceomarginata]|nr:hypothetical protein B0H14DRAFT_2582916 [Mycena olivaceomarginata]
MTRSKRKAAFERSILDYHPLLSASLLSLAALCLVLGLSVNRFTLAAAILSIPLTISTRSFISLRSQDRAAKHLNAQVIPRVKGKWPENLDVAIGIVNSFEEGHVLQIFADLLREHNTTTVNTRLFWDDQGHEICVLSSTEFDHFEKGILWHERIDKLLGTGLFNALVVHISSSPEGDLWKTVWTRDCSAILCKRRISDFEIFEHTSATTLNLIASRSYKHLPIDIQDLVARFTLDSASEFPFGMKLDTLSQPLTIPGKVKLGPKGSVPIDGATEFDEFTETFERVAVIITRRETQGDTWPLGELFEDKTEGSIATIVNWIEPVVKRAITEKERRKKEGLHTAANENVIL